jgi:nucleotide-binding universal stress UspA family protein
MHSYQILVPLDGSVLAECVLPHVVAIASVFGSKITLLRVIPPPGNGGESHVIDPLSWEMKKVEAVSYLQRKKEQLEQIFTSIEYQLAEGQPAEKIIEYARNENIDLIALSSHGQSGLHEWNISSVVQKIILHSQKSILLIRAYNAMDIGLRDVRYQKLSVPLDCSQRAELILPMAKKIAEFFDAQLHLMHVTREPEITCRNPPPQEELDWARWLTEHNKNNMLIYFEQLSAQMSSQGVEVKSCVRTSKNVLETLHAMMEEEKVELVLLTAHGSTGSHKWMYGNLATSFIIYGSTPVIILQDLMPEEIEESQAAIVAREYKGH